MVVWRFPQENATCGDLKKTTVNPKNAVILWVLVAPLPILISAEMEPASDRFGRVKKELSSPAAA
jgi:hypothetical protein